MTTFTTFTPSTAGPFSFTPTLDGALYTATVMWNLFGQRYYIQLVAQDGTLIFNLPLVGSPIGVNLQSLSWANGIVTATTAAPHGYRVGSSIDLTVSGCAPDAFNGAIQALITGSQTLTWPVAANPGTVTALGIVNWNLNLAAGYFEQSTLVFREPSQTFEVSP